MEVLEGDEFLEERLVIPFDLATTAWIVRSAEDQFNTVFLRFSFEDFGDELFSIIEVNFTRDSSGTKCPLQGVDC